MKERIIGIMGGMGPEATIDLFSKIVEETHAKSDNDHLRIIIDNNPKMPSRQDAILKGTESPVPAMVETAKNLQRAGADVIIIGANTAHYFYDDVKKQIDMPFLHIIDEAVKELKRQVPNARKVGVMATNAAVKTGLYNICCERFGLEVIKLNEDDQNQIHEAIFDFKYNGLSDDNINKEVEIANKLVGMGADALIMGCTEIPVILNGKKFPIPLIDPNEIIGKVAVKYAKNEYEI